MKAFEKDDGIILTQKQKECNNFVRKMAQAKARVAVVNEGWFEDIYKILRPNEEYTDGCMLGGVKIRFGDIKKYYFTK